MDLIDSYGEWIILSGCNVYITLTLKRTISHNHIYYREKGMDKENMGTFFAWNDMYRCKETAWRFRDRLDRSLPGSANRRRKGTQLPFFAFVEGNGRDKNFHLHCLGTRLNEVSDDVYMKCVKKAYTSLEWSHNRYTVQFFDSLADLRRTTFYSLKEGIDAFLPEASIPMN